MKIRTGVGPDYRPQFVEGSAYAVSRGWIAVQGGRLIPGAIQPPARSGALGDLASQIEAAAAQY